jgi:hypothetical protein
MSGIWKFHLDTHRLPLFDFGKIILGQCLTFDSYLIALEFQQPQNRIS